MISATAVSASLALALGLRHALDADHLAAVDGLTRWNAVGGRAFARYCGALFAAGHCAVLVVASLAFAGVRGNVALPMWLATAGAMLAAFLLVVFSIANLRAIAAHGRAGRGRTERATMMGGIRARLFGPLLRAPRPWQVALVGALFAVSFDTAGIAVLFAAAGDGALTAGATVSQALYLALVFAAGMLAVSTANGLWVAHLLEHSRLSGADASRLMGITISLAGLLVGCSALLPLFSTDVEQWFAAHEFAASLFVFAALIAGYLGALLLTSHGRFSRQIPTIN